MSSYLIYHPERCISTFDNLIVYHDSTEGNQDPYIWNKQFLHTYCHITEMRLAENSINFWVSGDTLFPTFSHLYCDLVFVVKQKRFWQQRNVIKSDDSMIDSDEAFVDHYQWVHQHPFNGSRRPRRRFTLKADSNCSFQPQDADRMLIDIVPFFESVELPLEYLRQVLKANIGSKPFCIDKIAVPLYQWLYQRASIKLKGEELQEIRKKNPQLRSR